MKYKYRLKSWKEYFYCEIPEGHYRPKFFLPIGYNPATITIKCSFILFAPFIVLFKLVVGMLWSLWNDLFSLANLVWKWTK